jgi:hypothetical protein
MQTVKLNTGGITTCKLSAFGALALCALALVACDRAPAPESAAKPAAETPGATAPAPALTSAERENLVRRSYQYVALFNTITNFAVNDKNPFAAGGWNKTHYPKGLMDATVRGIPRPNNDTLYVLSLLDLRKDPVVIQCDIRNQAGRFSLG